MSFENNIRNPIQGLRVKLRMELKGRGLKGKFKVRHTRNNCLVVECEKQLYPIDTFYGYKVLYKEKI